MPKSRRIRDLKDQRSSAASCSSEKFVGNVCVLMGPGGTDWEDEKVEETNLKKNLKRQIMGKVNGRVTDYDHIFRVEGAEAH